MRLLLATAFLAALTFQLSCADSGGWSWDGNNDKEEKAEASETVENVVNATNVDDVVDSILNSGRQGRNIKEYDEIYSDPSVQEVLQKGDDTDARNLIKDRLCSLGLMQCDEVEEKRPYISPEELVYAQPVDIKPIGRPIPSIPVKGPSRAIYGPPKPVPFPSKNGPPNRYYSHGSPNLGPIYNAPPNHGNSNHGPPRRYGPPPPSKPFLTKPPGPIYEPFIEPESPPYSFESSSSLNSGAFYQHKEIKKQPTIIETTDVQQHVHHHFHHNAEADGASKVPTVIVNNPVPVSSSASLSGAGFASSSFNSFKPSEEISGFGNSFKEASAFTGGYKGNTYGGQSIANYGSNSAGSFSVAKPVVENYGPQQFGSSASSTLYGSASNQNAFGSSVYGNKFNSASSLAASNYGSNSQNAFTAPVYGSNNLNYATSGLGAAATNSFGASVGSYGSSDFYKKELNIQGGQLNNLGSFNKYQGVQSGRGENYDCVCVPYDQCPSQDIIGRKDDFFLPLDPRNIKTDIQAEEERVITDGNGNMTVIRVSKDVGINGTKAENATAEAKKVSKREATEQKEEKAKVEPRQINNNKNIKPTFGVSFGLPHQGGHFDPLHHHHAGPGGINLGLVSVNPLVSIQLTKDDYGEKVIKPFVNLHVTPNDFLVHKVADFFAYKKDAIFNQHQHYHKHLHKPFYRPHSYGPHFVQPHFEGPYLDHPPYFEKPHFDHSYVDPPHFDHSYIEKPHFDHSYIEKPHFAGNYYEDSPSYGGGFGYDNGFYGRSAPNYTSGQDLVQQYQNQNAYGSSYQKYLNHPTYDSYGNPTKPYDRKGKALDNEVKFPNSRRRRDVTEQTSLKKKRQAYYGNANGNTCGPRHVCCRKPLRPVIPGPGANNRQCGVRHSQGINGRIKNPVYVDGDSEFGEYPWQVAILKKDPKESVYVCGGTLIDPLHIITAAHCVKMYTAYDLRVRLGEWDVNHDVEFFPYIERDVSHVQVHPEFYAGTLYNDLAIIRMDKPVDFAKYPHISPACLPSPHDDYTGTRCWTTGWGKDAFGDFGKYQNILKEVDVPIVGHGECQQRLTQTRLGYDFKLHPGFVCAGGEEGKDACKGDGGGPMVCERGGTWQVVGVVSWGIGCGQSGVPGVYVKVAQYLDWIRQVTQRY